MTWCSASSRSSELTRSGAACITDAVLRLVSLDQAEALRRCKRFSLLPWRGAAWSMRSVVLLGGFSSASVPLTCYRLEMLQGAPKTHVFGDALRRARVAFLPSFFPEKSVELMF